MQGGEYKTIVTTSVVRPKDGTFSTQQQVVTVEVLDDRFNMEEWADNNCARFRREGNKIDIYLSKNPYVSDRFFGVILRDPCGKISDTYLTFGQRGQSYRFVDDNDVDHTFVRGTENAGVERFKTEDMTEYDVATGSETPTKKLLTRVYKGKAVMSKPEIRKLHFHVHGGRCQAYVRGIDRYRICKDDNGKIVNQSVEFDQGITASLLPSHLVEHDTEGNLVCGWTLTVKSNGRPFSDNDDYFYLIHIGHYDNPNYYTEVEVRFMPKDGEDYKANGYATLKTEKITFPYNGGEKSIEIDFGNDEDCDWSAEITKEKDEEWLSFEYFPSGVKVKCQPINSVVDNERRECKITFVVNDKPMSCRLEQLPFNDYSVSTRVKKIVFGSEKGERQTITVISYGKELEVDNKDDVVSIEGLQSPVINGLTYTYTLYLITNNATKTDKEGELGFTAGGYGEKVTVSIEQKGEREQEYIDLDISEDKQTATITSPRNENGGYGYIVANSSGVWLEVSMGQPVDGVYTPAFVVKEENVYGLDRKSKVTFINANNMDDTRSCTVINKAGGTGYELNK